VPVVRCSSGDCVQPTPRGPETGTILHFGAFRLDADGMLLTHRGRVVELQRKVFDLLCVLARERARVVSKDELLARVWAGVHITESSLTRCVALARRATRDDARDPKIIRTVHGRGYQFVAPATTNPRSNGATVHARSEGWLPLIGRRREVAKLRQALRATVAGQGQLVFVLGEAGIGKTRLADELRSIAASAGVTVLCGRSHETEGAPAFWPWTQVLRGELLGRSPEDVRVLLGQDAPEIGRLVPELRMPGPAPLTDIAEQSGADRFRLFEAIVRVLERVARQRPLAVVFDDLHRADEPSLRLLRFVAEVLTEAPMLLLGTCRPAESVRAQVLSDVLGLARAHNLSLEGLSSVDVGRFVAASTGRRLSDAAVLRLREQTGGNPFFLSQMIPLLHRTASREGAPAMLVAPESVRVAVARRIEALPRPTRRLLRVAAALGREFTVDLLAAAIGLRHAVPSILAPALRNRLIVDVDGPARAYRFAHGLVRDVVCEQVRPRDRAHWHSRAATALQETGAGETTERVAELAAHAYHAVPFEGGRRAIDFAVRAGDHATAQLAYEEAARHYTRALDVLTRTAPSETARRCDLLLALGEAQMRSGDRVAAVATFERAVELARSIRAPKKLARAALDLAPGFLVVEAGVYDVSLVALLEEAAALLDHGDDALRAQVLGRLAMALRWAPDGEERRHHASREAVELAARTGDPATQAFVGVAQAVAIWGPDNFAYRLLTLPDALATAEAMGDLERAAVYRLFWITTLLEFGDAGSLDREVARYVQAAERLGQPRVLWRALLVRALQAYRVGGFPEAERRTQEFLEVGTRAGDRTAAQAFSAVLGVLAFVRGQLGQWVEPLHELARRHPAIRPWQVTVALALGQGGLHAEAGREIARIGAHSFADLPRNEDWLLDMAVLAEACATIGDRRHAAEVLALLGPYEDRYVPVGIGGLTLGSVAYFLGRLAATLGRFAEAEAHLAVAVRRNRGLCEPFAILAQWHYTELLRRSGSLSGRSAATRIRRHVLARGRALGMCLRVVEEPGRNSVGT
jgi:eukaryotic-like serine/threonine-protein kinase